MGFSQYFVIKRYRKDWETEWLTWTTFPDLDSHPICHINMKHHLAHWSISTPPIPSVLISGSVYSTPPDRDDSVTCHCGMIGSGEFDVIPLYIFLSEQMCKVMVMRMHAVCWVTFHKPTLVSLFNVINDTLMSFSYVTRADVYNRKSWGHMRIVTSKGLFHYLGKYYWFSLA